MRLSTTSLLLSLAAAAACATASPEPSGNSPARGGLLYVWAQPTDSTRAALLALVDIRAGVPDTARLLRVIPAGPGSRGAHHTEHALDRSGWFFTNAFGSGQTFLFDLRDPDRARLVTSFGDVGPYSHPHSYVRLADGRTLATFQWKSGGALPGGLVELDAEARPIRWASAAPTNIDSTQIVPYSLAVLPELDRVVSTSTHMIEDLGVHVQIWRLSDLKLLHTLPVPIAGTHAGHDSHDGEHHRLPGEPRVLADGRTVMFGTFTCGLYRVTGVDGGRPEVAFSAAFPGEMCAVPVVIGRYWIQTVPALHAVIALDVSDPARPVEASRVVFPEEVRPHWLAADEAGRRLVVTSASRKDPTIHLLDFDAATGRLSRSPGAPVIDLRGLRGPDGHRIDAVPHGVVFAR